MFITSTYSQLMCTCASFTLRSYLPGQTQLPAFPPKLHQSSYRCRPGGPFMQIKGFQGIPGLIQSAFCSNESGNDPTNYGHFTSENDRNQWI